MVMVAKRLRALVELLSLLTRSGACCHIHQKCHLPTTFSRRQRLTCMATVNLTVSSVWASLRGSDSQYTRASRRGCQQRRGKVIARCCYLSVPVHLPEAQTLFLNSVWFMATAKPTASEDTVECWRVAKPVRALAELVLMPTRSGAWCHSHQQRHRQNIFAFASAPAWGVDGSL